MALRDLTILDDNGSNHQLRTLTQRSGMRSSASKPAWT